MDNSQEQEQPHSAADIADRMRRQLLSQSMIQHLTQRKLEVMLQMTELEIAGSPEKVSAEAGLFQFYKGKIDGFDELLDDHKQAAEQLASLNTPQQQL